MQAMLVECFILRKEVNVQRLKYNLKNWLGRKLGVSSSISVSVASENFLA